MPAPRATGHRAATQPGGAKFTFDHVVHGIIAAERYDTDEHFLIVAESNEVFTRVLVPGRRPW